MKGTGSQVHGGDGAIPKGADALVGDQGYSSILPNPPR